MRHQSVVVCHSISTGYFQHDDDYPSKNIFIFNKKILIISMFQWYFSLLIRKSQVYVFYLFSGGWRLFCRYFRKYVIFFFNWRLNPTLIYFHYFQVQNTFLTKTSENIVICWTGTLEKTGIHSSNRHTQKYIWGHVHTGSKKARQAAIYLYAIFMLLSLVL